MSITLDLPLPLDEEIALEASREGVPAADHAAVLLCLAASLLRGDTPTPFQQAVRGFLASHAVDADRVSSVFEELVRVCLEAIRGEGQASGVTQEGLAGLAQPQRGPSGGSVSLPSLRAWRNAVVHRPIDRSVDNLVSDTAPSKTLLQRAGRLNRKRVSAYGKYAGIIPSSEEFMRERQKEIAREDGREE